MKKRHIFTLLLIYSTLAYANNDYANPALNPVSFKKPLKHTPLQLLKNGKLNFAIAFDHKIEDINDKNLDKRRSVRHGVKALQQAIKKCTGQEAPVIDANSSQEAKKYKYLILVGKSSLTDKLGLKPLCLPKEGFEVLTFPEGVAIAGYDGSLTPGGYSKLDWRRIRQNGTSNGVYDFIERFLGVRYYYPGPGVVWPQIKNLTLQPVHYTDQPVFHNRFSHHFESSQYANWSEDWSDYKNDFPDFVWRWRIARGNQFMTGHTPLPQKWLAAHPDKKNILFYRNPSGHLFYEPRQHIGNYYDISNLELANMYANDCKRFYETGWNAPWKGHYAPNSQCVLFGQSDTFMNNMSTSVISELKLIPEKLRGNREGELSNVYARFYIELGKKLKEILPGKRLCIMPYHNYSLPPNDPRYSKFPDNIDMGVCIYDFPCTITNPEKAKFWKKQLKKWYEVSGNRPVAGIWIYDHYFPFETAVICRFVGEIPKKMGKYLGREEMFFSAKVTKWNYYIPFYVAYRAVWNPDFNVKAALDEMWPLLYGKAAPYLKEFDNILVDRWIKVFAIKGTKSSVYQEAYPLTLLDKMENLLKKAEASLEPGSPEMLRYRNFAAPWPKAIKRMRGSILFQKPLYKVKRLKNTEKIILDGKLDEASWENADSLIMQDPYGSGEKQKSITGKLLWDNGGLYSGFHMRGSPLANSQIGKFKNDNVEIFLAPGKDLKNFFQFMVSSVNEAFTGKKTLKPVPTPFNKTWDCKEFKHSVNLQQDGWSMEAYIPFKAMEEKTPEPYSCWHANFVGNKISLPKEYSSFSLTQGRNHNFELFGNIYFLGAGD